MVDSPMAEKQAIDGATATLLKRSLKLDDFLPGMSPEDIEKFFPKSGLYDYPKDSHVLEQGDRGRDVCILVSGKIAITQVIGSAGVVLATLAPSDIFGEVALLREGKRVATAVAEADCRVFLLVFEDVEALLLGNPALGDHLKKLAAERLKT